MSHKTREHEDGARSSQPAEDTPVPRETRNSQLETDIPPPVAAVLCRHGVAASRVDPHTVSFAAVPVSDQFSKPRTNLLVQRPAPNGGSAIYVDSDLAYTGADAAMLRLLTGPSHRDWRRLRIPPVPGTLAEVLCVVLELFGSPLAGDLRAAASNVAASVPLADRNRDGCGYTESERPRAADLQIGPVLAAVGERIPPELAAESYRTCLRKELALRVATVVTRPTHPHAAVLWAAAGAGRDHLMLAAAHLLLEARRTARVIRVSGGLIAAGCIFQAEVDSAFLRVLTEAAGLGDCVLLVQDLDVCLTGSPASLSVLCGALDKGLRLLATARSDAALGRLQRDEPLARRLLAVEVPSLDRAETGEALSQFAAASGLTADATVLQATLNLAAKRGGAEPAASLGLLGSAIADAAWRGGRELHPDDIFAAPRGEWPDAPPDTGKE
ncbi:MAG: hypothetical protein FJ290_04760 [Planctomycetes bacterium]|nr:hypothetical protein [Planctomycetota bacterium]